MTSPIVSQKTSTAKAKGRLSKSFGLSRLCSALVIVCGSGSLLFGQQIVQPNWNGIGPEDLAETVFYSLSTLGEIQFSIDHATDDFERWPNYASFKYLKKGLTYNTEKTPYYLRYYF